MFNNYKYLISYLKENPKAYFIVIAISSMTGVLEIFGITSILPLISIYLGDSGITLPRQFDFLFEIIGIKGLIICFILVILIQTILLFLSESYFLKKMGIWRTQLTTKYEDNLINSDFSHISKLMPGEAEVIITRNVGYAVRNRHKTALFISNLVISVFYLVIAIYLSPQAFVLFLFLGSIYGLFNLKFLKLRVDYSKRSSESYLRAAQSLSEYIFDFRGLQTSKKGFLKKIIEKYLEDASYVHVKNDIINSSIRIMGQPIMLFLLVCGVIISKTFFQLTNPQILIMLYIFYRSAPKLISISKGYGEIIQDSPVDLTPEIVLWEKRKRKNNSTRKVQIKSNKIELKKISFNYKKNQVLRDININIKKGDLFLLTGKSGSGKSTLLDIICGFLKPSEGTINIFGHNPLKQSYESLLVPYVSILRPETNVVQGTILSNIAYLIESPNLKRVKKLVHKVGLESLLNKNGLNKKIEPKGGNISAGQRQRLLIARALYKEPELLILDEPTSNLDFRTEKEINKLLFSIREKTTMIVVSHNKLLKNEATQVYELKNSNLIKIK